MCAGQLQTVSARMAAFRVPVMFSMSGRRGAWLLAIAGAALPMVAQGNSGSVTGVVQDASGAIVPGATVEINSPTTGYDRTAVTDATGTYRFYNVPFHPYRLTVTAGGFAASTERIDVESAVETEMTVKLALGTSSTVVNVDAGADLLENDTSMHTDVDRSTIARLPLESQSSSLSSIVTLASPGVAADSNGLFHGLGDHAENSFSVDGQPITDQQSKVFSNQLPADAVQSLEVIDGAPPAEYGDKTSLVIVATTRSGQGVTTPHGNITASYGTFGSTNIGGNVAYGGQRWGNFLTVSGLQSGRFLDPPEFVVFHSKGNEENFFDRVDYQLSDKNTLHTNLQYTRSWFQTPNGYDQINVLDQFGNSVGNSDQRSKIETFNIAPVLTRVINPFAVMNLGGFVRRDGFSYFHSNNPLADLGPIQQESVGQFRTLTNAGAHTDVTYIRGRQNIKIGAIYQQTFLRENDSIALVAPGLNAPCLDAAGNPLNGFSTAEECVLSENQVNPNFNPVLLPYDLTRGGQFYQWHGQTDVKQFAAYAQDSITAGNWLFNIGIRGDIYNGLSNDKQAEPRAGVSYTVKQTGTVLRASYARAFETPFNENLVLSVNGCKDPVLQGVFLTLGQCTPAPFNPGYRNEFHAGFQQAASRHLVISADYIWKYTHNAYDFSVLGLTPITFPIEWKNSKIPGFVLKVTVPETHGMSAFVTMSSVAARFFNPQVGGVGATVGSASAVDGTPGVQAPGLPFRIDHDERYNQTSHIQYTLPFKNHHSAWMGFNWRYDSGLVAGAVPCYNVVGGNTPCGGITLANGQPGIDLSGLSADEQFQAGLTCDGVRATPTSGFQQCDAVGLTSKLVKIPAPNTEDDDKNPPRVAPRSLFDIALGDDNLFHMDKHKIGVQVTAVNVANQYALYNFLSTFSGTHYVTPRAITGELRYSF